MYKSKHRKTTGNKKTLIIALACVLVLAAAVFIFVSWGMSGGTPDVTDKPTGETTNAASAPTQTDTAGTDTSAAVTDSAADTTGSDKTETQTEAPVTTNPPFVPDTGYDYNGVKEGNAGELSSLSKAVFIGDSRTEGLRLYTSLASSGAKIYASVGMMVNNVLTETMADYNGKKVTVPEALRAEPDFDSVYIMLGINELGWVYTQSYIDAYAKIIDELRTINPSAKIYIQSLIPVTREKSDTDPIYTNARIEEYNKALSALAAEKGVLYLNVAEIFSSDGGALPAEASNDGVHLKKAYCDMWLEYILTHRA